MARDDTGDRQAPDTARDADAQIGAYIAELRTGARMTQAELATKMRAHGWKWSQQSCWAIEKGRQTLRLQEALDLAHILGVEVWWLLKYAEREELEGSREYLRQMYEAHGDIVEAVARYENLRRQLALELDRPHRPLPEPWRSDIVNAAGTNAIDVAQSAAAIGIERRAHRPKTAVGPIVDLYYESLARIAP